MEKHKYFVYFLLITTITLSITLAWLALFKPEIFILLLFIIIWVSILLLLSR